MSSGSGGGGGQKSCGSVCRLGLPGVRTDLGFQEEIVCIACPGEIEDQIEGTEVGMVGQHACCHTHNCQQTDDTHTHTNACSIPYSTVQTVSVHLEHCYQSCLQVLQRKLQRKPGQDTSTGNTQTGTMQQRLVLRAHYNLGSAKSSLSISEHLGVKSH